MADIHFSTAVRFGSRCLLIDENDLNLLEGRDWYVNQGYLKSKPCGRVLIHREIMSPPKHMVVDHINGNTLDNRRRNLRVCTTAQNIQNRKLSKNNKTGVKGVYIDGRKDRRPLYVAEIKANGKKYFLGRYESLDAAAAAYRSAAESLHGEFARLE